MRKVYCDKCGKDKTLNWKGEERKKVGKVDDLIELDEDDILKLIHPKKTLTKNLIDLLQYEFDLCEECIEWLWDSLHSHIGAYYHAKEKKIMEEFENGKDKKES